MTTCSEELNSPAEVLTVKEPLDGIPRETLPIVKDEVKATVENVCVGGVEEPVSCEDRIDDDESKSTITQVQDVSIEAVDAINTAAQTTHDNADDLNVIHVTNLVEVLAASADEVEATSPDDVHLTGADVTHTTSTDVTSADDHVICMICRDWLPASGLQELSSCHCQLCLPCLLTWFQLKIRDCKVVIRCPNPYCQVRISEGDLLTHLPSEDYNRYFLLKVSRSSAHLITKQLDKNGKEAKEGMNALLQTMGRMDVQLTNVGRNQSLLLSFLRGFMYGIIFGVSGVSAYYILGAKFNV